MGGSSKTPKLYYVIYEQPLTTIIDDASSLSSVVVERKEEFMWKSSRYSSAWNILELKIIVCGVVDVGYFNVFNFYIFIIMTTIIIKSPSYALHWHWILLHFAKWFGPAGWIAEENQRTQKLEKQMEVFALLIAGDLPT